MTLIDQDQWTHATVKAALVEAFVVCERTAGRVGPRVPKSAWNFAYDLNDIWEQRRTGTNAVGREARPQVTAEQIARSEFVLMGGKAPGGAEVPAWLNGILGETHERVALELWAFHEMRKEMGRNRQTVADICLTLGWSKATFDRRVSHGAFIIAERLNVSACDSWYAAAQGL